jgi:hypothetical protein
MLWVHDGALRPLLPRANWQRASLRADGDHELAGADETIPRSLERGEGIGYLDRDGAKSRSGYSSLT